MARIRRGTCPKGLTSAKVILNLPGGRSSPYYRSDEINRVDRGSNAIPAHQTTAGSAKLPDWLIREAEETLENNIRGLQTKVIGNGDPMQSVIYQISLYPPHENRKIEIIVRKRHQLRSLERTKDGTTKMRDMSKSLTSANLDN